MLDQQQRDNLFLALSGTEPTWSDYTFLTDANSRPSAAGDGFSVGTSIVTGVQVTLEASLKRWAIVLDGAVAAGDYTVTINGTDYTVTAAGTESASALIALIAAEIVSTAVTAVDTTIDGDEPAVLLTSTAVTPPTVAVTGDLILTQQATSVDFTLWGYTGGEWSPLNAGSFDAVSVGWIEQVRTGIFSRLAVEIEATDGLVAFRVGPCKAVAS